MTVLGSWSTEDLFGMHVVMIGNPVDGFTIYGPFKTGEDAILWAQDEVETDWWIAKVFPPYEDRENDGVTDRGSKQELEDGQEGGGG